MLSTPRRVDFEYESLEGIVCHLCELISLNISAFEGALRKTLYIDFENVSTSKVDAIHIHPMSREVTFQ